MTELYKALIDFQQEIPNIYKNATGYGYKFADLGEINDVIKPILKKHGLGYVQPLDGEFVKTIVFHAASGESIESIAHIPQDVQLKGMNDFQVMGSAITYLRRYTLSSLLGLITDEDADAAGEQVKDLKKQRNANTDYSKSGADQEIAATERDQLSKAKIDIFNELTAQGYESTVSKKAFINSVLKKDVITTLNDADLVGDALYNTKEVLNDGVEKQS